MNVAFDAAGKIDSHRDVLERAAVFVSKGKCDPGCAGLQEEPGPCGIATCLGWKKKVHRPRSAWIAGPLAEYGALDEAGRLAGAVLDEDIRRAPIDWGFIDAC